MDAKREMFRWIRDVGDVTEDVYRQTTYRQIGVIDGYRLEEERL